ncbi:MAG: hypothetical protein LBE38_11010 [Deltaproteobacteria bacterium]|nr:hypothetical protein [Deltaproteobacteria bacterium]
MRFIHNRARIRAEESLVRNKPKVYLWQLISSNVVAPLPINNIFGRCDA